MTRLEAENIVNRIIANGKKANKESVFYSREHEIHFLFGWLQSAFAGMLCNLKVKAEKFDDNGYYKS